jgi:hypothetical protein
MKAFVLNEGEHGWRGFLHDKDCCSEVVQKYLPGIARMSSVVWTRFSRPRDELRTIVTSNGDHFIRGIHKAQNRDINPRCEDCWGPRHPSERGFGTGIRTEDSQHKSWRESRNIRLPWRSVGWANLCVKDQPRRPGQRFQVHQMQVLPAGYANHGRVVREFESGLVSDVLIST